MEGAALEGSSGKVVPDASAATPGSAEARDALSRGIAAQFADAVPEPLLVADAGGLIAFVNVPCRDVFGYGAAELNGLSMQTLLPALTNGQSLAPDPGTRQLEGRRADGSRFPVEVTFAWAGWENQELSVAIIRDLTEQERGESELRRTRDRLIEAQHLARLGSWDWDITENKVTWSDELFRIFGLEPGAIEPSYEAFLERVHPEDREAVNARNQKALADHRPLDEIQRGTKPDGSVFLMRCMGEVITNDANEPVRMLGTCEDVTVEKDAERAQAELAALVRSSSDAIVATTLGGEITSWNRGAERLYGYPAEEAIGQRGRMMIPEEHLQEQRDKAATLAAGGTVEHFETRLRRADGTLIDVSLGMSPVRDANGEPMAISTIGRDITERKAFEKQLRRLANQDPLTGLVNRRRFEEELHTRVAHARRYGSAGAVLMLDLDNFKYVNDAFGHGAGDDVLRSTGRLLRSRLRETDVLARLGGDEFAALLPEADADAATKVAKDMLEALRGHVVPIDDRPIGVTASIGVAFFGADTETSETLLAQADRAMYAAKDSGRDRAETVRDADRSRVVETRMGWEHRIHKALEQDLFVLHSQPIMDLQSGRISQHELLLRMKDGDDLIAPGAFLGVAERLGLIQAIDRWVVGEAIRLLTVNPTVRLEVNLSALSVDDSQLIDLIRGGLKQHAVDPGRLIFEITETAAIGNLDVARELAETLLSIGCSFALDDFGAGFGSFYYLKHMPAEYLKIDGDFVRAPRGRTDELVIDAIVRIAQGLGKRTIAEFVEDGATLEKLREVGVDYAQGFYVGRPAPVDQLSVR